MKKFLRDAYRRNATHLYQLRDKIFGNSNYKKFVIISESRTGSTLLKHLMHSHPKIIALGEEFKLLKKKSSEQVWNEVFRKYPKKVEWVGFKLFYTHPLDSDDKTVWKHLNEDKEIIIIHLTRKNLLRSHVSRQIGLKTNQWTESVNNPKLIPKELKKISLSFEDCKKNFQQLENYYSRILVEFKRHKIIPIAYEDLDRDKQGALNEIFKQLDVNDHQIGSLMRKQNPESLKELVSNYEELKEKFTGTKWQHFFIEP